MDFPNQLTIADYTQKSWTFKSSEAFEQFIKKQFEFWSLRLPTSHLFSTANAYIQKANYFKNILDTLEIWKPQFKDWDVNSFNSNFTNLIHNNIGTSWVWSGHPFIEKWVQLSQVSANTADAFFEAYLHKSTSRYSNGFDFFQGYIIAYEYINSDSDIQNRRASESKSLSDLRDDLVEKTNEVLGDATSFQKEIKQWKKDTISNHNVWKKSQQRLFDDSLLANSKNFHEQLAGWINAHSELENKFREKLRFDSAATYWGIKAIKFRNQGFGWGAGLVVSLILGIVIFSNYFLAWLSGQPSGLGLQSIEGVLLFATILSSFAFLIKSLSKLTFSSFHLQRDAEERQQLTHLYLALRDGANEDVESRKIILQSLFSRSESGLLTNEHGPTMPVITDYLGKVGK